MTYITSQTCGGLQLAICWSKGDGAIKGPLKPPCNSRGVDDNSLLSILKIL